MPIVDTIAVLNSRNRKEEGSFIILMCLSLMLATFLRISLLVVYPLVAIFIVSYYKFKMTSSLLALLVLAGVSFLASLFGPFFLKYKLFSLYHMLPLLLLLFTNPSEKTATRYSNILTIFIGCLTAVVVINNIIGIIQVLRHPSSDDSFIGLYSEYSVSLNGLVILNTVIFLYYFLLFLYQKKLRHIIASVFFLACSILGFYGGGLIICMIAFILTFFNFRLFSIVKTVAVAAVSIIAIYFVMRVIKPVTLEYNIANLKKISSFDLDAGPRKIKSFYNYFVSYPKDVKDFLLGSGPGTFNSRSAFMVGSPSYFGKIGFIKDEDQPYYFKNYAYSLWNDSNTQKDLYLDGFRNQPFSSILAFLGEYGFIFFACFCCFYYMYYRSVSRLYKYTEKTPHREIYFKFFKFLIVLLPLLLLIDNFLEYPEIILPVALGIKFAHTGLLSLKTNINHES